MSFITDGASVLPAIKSNARPPSIPEGSSEWAAADCNQIRTALLDLRTAVLAGAPPVSIVLPSTFADIVDHAGWTAVGPSSPALVYKLAPGQIVFGLVTTAAGASGTALATLPTGYIPQETVNFIPCVFRDSSASLNYSAYAQVQGVGDTDPGQITITDVVIANGVVSPFASHFTVAVNDTVTFSATTLFNSLDATSFTGTLVPGTGWILSNQAVYMTGSTVMVTATVTGDVGATVAQPLCSWDAVMAPITADIYPVYATITSAVLTNNRTVPCILAVNGQPDVIVDSYWDDAAGSFAGTQGESAVGDIIEMAFTYVI